MGGVPFWYGIYKAEIRKIKCNSPGDCCSRRLDGAKHIFSPRWGKNANESLQAYQNSS